jgi:5-methylcytosine-specific restriction protein A
MPNIPRSTRLSYQPKPVKFQGHVYTTFYSNAPWRKLRKVYLQSHPLCEHCKQQGIINNAVDIDHIHPINAKDPYNTQGGKYGNPLDPANLQALCKACHIKKTAKQRKHE